MKKYLFFFVMAISMAVWAQNINDVIWLNPKPTGVPIRFVQYIDSSTVVAGGSGGVFLKSTDAGISFTQTFDAGPYISALTNHIINGGYFFDKNNGFLCGYDGITKTTDGGITFIQPGAGNTFLNQSVFRMGFTDSLHGFAIGTFPLAVTKDGGNTWNMTPAGNAGGWMWDIQILDKNTIILAGDYSGGTNIHISNDGGNSWTDYAAGNYGLYSMRFANRLVGYAASPSTVYKTTDGGVSWNPLSLTFSQSTIFTRILAHDSTVTLIGDPQYVYESTDGGNTFSQTYFVSPSQNGFPMTMMDADQLGSNIIMVGGAGLVFRSYNNGLSWNTNCSYPEIGETIGIWGSKVDGRRIAVGGSVLLGGVQGPGKQIIVSTDYGSTWVAKDAGTCLTTWIDGIDMVNEKTGFLYGEYGNIFKTNDGGLTWDSVGYTNNQNAVRWLSFADENVGIAITNNNYSWKTTDGGSTWNAITFPNGGRVEGGITCLDEMTYIAPSPANNIISKTTDGGITWTTTPPPASNFGGVGYLRMINKNWGLMVGSSFLYRTRDAGSTWENIPASSGGLDVAIQDTSNYIVSGALGSLMRTKNGGATWSRMQSGTLGDLANICLVSNDTLLIGSWQNYSSMNVMKIPLNSFTATASLKLKQPLGGEIFKIGTYLPIIWTSNIVDYVKIDFSTDSGVSWTTIAAHDSAPLGYHPWTIPNTPSLHCFIRITDVSNPALYDSTSAFTIDVPPTSFWIPVNSGTSEGIWGVDYSSPDVAWICASTGDIRKSTDGGMTFNSVGQISDVTYTIAALTDQVALVATSPSSGDGKIYKTTDGGHTWNQVYTAVGAWFDLISKIDANNLWALSDPVGGKYLIVKSSDAGNTWTVAPNLPDAPSGFYGAIGGYDQTGNTIWFGVGGLPGVYTTNHIYKSTNLADGPWTVTTTTEPSPGALSFSSEKGNGIAAFWNLQYKIDRTTDGGDTWTEVLTKTGAPHTIGYIRGTSTAYLASSDGNVYKTSDDGATWAPEPLPVGIGGEPFFIRLSSDGSNGLIGGNTGYMLKKVNATSLSPLTIIFPNGSEQLNAASNYNIKWYCYSSLITNVKLEYTTDNGTTWLLIATNVPANQVTYFWTVPSTLTQTAKIRVSDVATGLITDMSDNVFLIISPTGIKDPNKVTNYELSQNYPNPFNPSTTIRYAIKNDGKVSLKVYDILGREVAVLVNEYQQEGNYNIKFDAHKLASGIYLYRLESGNFNDTKKFILLK